MFNNNNLGLGQRHQSIGPISPVQRNMLSTRFGLVLLALSGLCACGTSDTNPQYPASPHSVARQWNEILLESIRKLDVPIVQGCVLTIAFGYVMVNLLTDLLYAVVDPRIRIK